MRWGLVPFFAKSPADFKGFSTFDAKAETVTIPAGMARGRRCLVPAEGSYEWKVLGPKEKQPYAFTVGEDSTFAFAGLWDTWHNKKTGQWPQSFAILTTPNKLTPWIMWNLHSRQFRSTLQMTIRWVAVDEFGRTYKAGQAVMNRPWRDS